ncbi:hypothetical protein EOD39_7376 [Acipenser ruthenus]|uniref:Uncharacterized protein n=1 Tax=Acipenser ruthenus TaxID=7906 RepID=A0A444U704_ACIRT|nr:hypothetical protein EOD39_7376 [Acipenser ruthenus]
MAQGEREVRAHRPKIGEGKRWQSWEDGRLPCKLKGHCVIIVEGEEETAGASSRTEMAGAQVSVKQGATSLPDMHSARPTTANYSMTIEAARDWPPWPPPFTASCRRTSPVTSALRIRGLCSLQQEGREGGRDVQSGSNVVWLFQWRGMSGGRGRRMTQTLRCLETPLLPEGCGRSGQDWA